MMRGVRQGGGSYYVLQSYSPTESVLQVRNKASSYGIWIRNLDVHSGNLGIITLTKQCITKLFAKRIRNLKKRASSNDDSNLCCYDTVCDM